MAVASAPGEGISIRKTLSALLLAEVSVHYVYALRVAGRTEPALALSVEDMDQAARILVQQGLELVGQDELEERD